MRSLVLRARLCQHYEGSISPELQRMIEDEFGVPTPDIWSGMVIAFTPQLKSFLSGIIVGYGPHDAGSAPQYVVEAHALLRQNHGSPIELHFSKP